MKVFDLLWGEFCVPKYLRPLVMAPEFRRLSNVRLLNVNSPSLASLSDVSRYSHTLGVLRLALANPMLGFSSEEHKAFLAAVLVHDAGTPAFAHLFEYFLGERHNWSHEEVTPDLLRGRLSPDEKATQIFHSHTPRFQALCEAARIDFNIVSSIISKSNRASPLLFGTLDYDNLDNVARMNAFLGKSVETSRILDLAAQLGVGTNATLLLPEDHEEDVRYWLGLRRAAYEVLIFDSPTVAAQAVLSSAIDRSLQDGTLNLRDWIYTDNELIGVLRGSSPEVKRMMDRDFLGSVPHMQVCLHLEDLSHPLSSRSRSEVCSLVLEFMRRQRMRGRLYGYCFRDKGTFEKEIFLVDPHTGSEWSVGRQSSSLVVYGFSSEEANGNARDAGRKFAQWAE